MAAADASSRTAGPTTAGSATGGPTAASATSDDGQVAATTTRILRVMSIAIGATSALFLVLLGLTIVRQWEAAALWWNLLAVLWVVATASAMIGAGIDGRTRRVRIVAGCVAASYLPVTVLRIVAQDAPLESGDVVWLLHLAAIPVMSAAFAFRPAIVIGHLLASGAAVAVVRWWCGAEQSVLLGVQNGVQTIVFCLMFVVIALSLVRSGRSADRALATARRENANEASRRARREVGERIDALIHDRVLATLLLAGRATAPADREVASRSAQDAIEALDRQRDDDQHALTPTRLVWTAQGLVRDLDPEVQFGYELTGEGDEPGGRGDVDGAGEGASGAAVDAASAASSAKVADSADDAHTALVGDDTIPGEVGDALVAAMLEALRNSLRHAGREDRPTTRAVHIDAGPDRVAVTVLDDGAGFDVERVDTARLGIVSSIRARVQAVGGTAQLVSKVGQGTRVALTWDRRIAAERAKAVVQRNERPWRQRARVSPLDLDFWIGPPPDEGGTAAGTEDSAREGDAQATEAPAEAAKRRAGRGRTEPTAREARARRRLSRSIQREPLLFFAVPQVLSNVMLSFTSNPELAATWQNIVALVLYAAAAALVVFPNETPLGVPPALAALVGTTLVTVLMSVIVPENPGYFAWHFGANTLLFLAIALRGRIRGAWAGMVAMLAVSVLVLHRAEPGVLISLFDRNLGVLLAGSVAAVMLKRTINSTLAIERERDVRAAREAAHTAGAEERERILRRFEASAMPMLREIAADDAVDDARRREWLAVEADLRDRIRARALDVEPLRGAVQRARERGVRVVVLADEGGRSVAPADLTRATEWAAELVDGATDGDEVTVRLRATERGHALTVVGAEVGEYLLGAERAAGAMAMVDQPGHPLRR